MMKNKILKSYPNSVFDTKKDTPIYIADFKERTQNIRGVEINVAQPHDPNTPNEEMPCFVLNNPSHQTLEFNIFDDNQFKDEDRKDLKHGEGCFFPSKNDGRSWLCILEIKDCAPGNVSSYNKDVFEKMESMYTIFRSKVGIPNTIYFIVSFPQKKTSFNQYIYEDYVEKKRMKKTFMVASNSATVIDNHFFDPYK